MKKSNARLILRKRCSIVISGDEGSPTLHFSKHPTYRLRLLPRRQPRSRTVVGGIMIHCSFHPNSETRMLVRTLARDPARWYVEAVLDLLIADLDRLRA